LAGKRKLKNQWQLSKPSYEFWKLWQRKEN
jgi:hypothetical protein